MSFLFSPTLVSKNPLKFLGMTEQIRHSLYQFFAWIQPAELWLFKHINQIWTTDWMNDFFPSMTDLHKQSWFFYVFPILILLIVFKKYRVHSMTIIVSLGLCLAWNDFTGGRVKRSIQRPRPFQSIEVTGAIQRSPASENSSFYSNHSSNNFAMAAP